MRNGYVEERNGGYYVVGTRVSLDSVVYAYLRGESPEGIAESFPALSLEQIFGALAFYAAHRSDIDRYLSAGRSDFEALRAQWRQSHPELYQRLAEAKRTPVPGA
ncbi:MAG: DUF433 domain-containing protein [Acidobacteriota bacterium]